LQALRERGPTPLVDAYDPKSLDSAKKLPQFERAATVVRSKSTF